MDGNIEQFFADLPLYRAISKNQYIQKLISQKPIFGEINFYKVKKKILVDTRSKLNAQSIHLTL